MVTDLYLSYMFYDVMKNSPTKNDRQYSVEMSKTPNSKALKISVGGDTPLVVGAAFGLYIELIQALKDNDVPVAKRKSTN